MLGEVFPIIRLKQEGRRFDPVRGLWIASGLSLIRALLVAHRLFAGRGGISGEVGMPLYIKDDYTAGLVEKLAKRRGVTKQDAVKLAVQAALDADAEAVPLAARLESFWQDNPMPPPTGMKADKAFFDDLSGDA